MLVCGRYEGFDERVRAHVDEEISLGDFVMTGGEVAAMAIIDAVRAPAPGRARQRGVDDRRVAQPGDGGPARVPALHAPGGVPGRARPGGPAGRQPRGDRQVAARAGHRRARGSAGRTSGSASRAAEREAEATVVRRCAIALVHHPVLDAQGAIVTTAVTNLDVHDLARSARTYGCSDYFVVHPIAAQRELVARICDHWIDGPGGRRSMRTDSNNYKQQGSLTKRPAWWKDQLLSALTIPDKYWGWYFPAKRAGENLLRTTKFDAILSTSPPATGHLIGLNLKEHYKIPWIMDFRDPWLNHTVVQSSQPKWRRALDARMESRCIEAADLVVCNTVWQHNIMSTKYREQVREKFVTLTNGFEEVGAPVHTSVKRHTPIICLHLGGVYEGRRIDTFCKSLAGLIRSGRLDPSAIRISFVGDIDQAHIASCRDIAPELIDSGMVDFRSRVNKEIARDLLWNADLLLVFQGEYRAQIPLKFYEYLATRKPIFAVGQSGALSELMAEASEGIWAEEDDPVQMGESFLTALKLAPKPPDQLPQSLIDRFHFRSLTRQLALWIRKLANNSGKQA